MILPVNYIKEKIMFNAIVEAQLVVTVILFAATFASIVFSNDLN